MSDKKCESCRHFHKQPRTSPDLSVSTVGECREQLRILVQGTPQGPALVPYYAQVPATWDACGQYE